MTPLVAYLLLAVAVGFGFIFVHLVLGKLIRPSKPGPEKQTIYECGEPTIGTAWVQFDLRFYVIALLFVIFDVEVAFFFPWAEVFGTANAVRLVDAPPEGSALQTYRDRVKAFQPADHAVVTSAAVSEPPPLTQQQVESNQAAARKLAWIALFDILVFFGVLLVGFAYLWRRGDLAWVRSVSDRAAVPLPTVAPRAAPSVAAGAAS